MSQSVPDKKATKEFTYVKEKWKQFREWYEAEREGLDPTKRRLLVLFKTKRSFIKWGIASAETAVYNDAANHPYNTCILCRKNTRWHSMQVL